MNDPNNGEYSQDGGRDQVMRSGGTDDQAGKFEDASDAIHSVSYCSPTYVITVGN